MRAPLSNCSCQQYTLTTMSWVRRRNCKKASVQNTHNLNINHIQCTGVYEINRHSLLQNLAWEYGYYTTGELSPTGMSTYVPQIPVEQSKNGSWTWRAKDTHLDLTLPYLTLRRYTIGLVHNSPPSPLILRPSHIPSPQIIFCICAATFSEVFPSFPLLYSVSSSLSMQSDLSDLFHVP